MNGCNKFFNKSTYQNSRVILDVRISLNHFEIDNCRMQQKEDTDERDEAVVKELKEMESLMRSF